MPEEQQMEQNPATPSREETKTGHGPAHTHEAAEEHLRPAAGATVDECRVRGKEVWDDALQRVRSFQNESKLYVRANPIKAVFTALGVGFVLGLIVRR